MRRYLCFQYPELALNRGVKFHDGEYTAETLEEISEVEGSSSFVHGVIIVDQSSLAAPEPEPEPAPVEPPELEDIGAESVVGYEDMSKGDLKALCDERGIVYTSRTSKPELIAALEA